MNLESIKDFAFFLNDLSENVVVQEGSPLSEKAHPNSIKNRIKTLLNELSNSSLENLEKSKLHSHLASSLKRYLVWMNQNEQALRSVVDSYEIIASKLRARETKIMEQATKLLQLHQKKPSIQEAPKSIPDRIDHFQRELAEACGNVVMTRESQMTKNLNPSYVQKEVEQLSSSAVSTAMEKNKQATLLVKLVKSLEMYVRWMQKNKSHLQERLLSYDEVEQKIQKLATTITKQAEQLVKVEKKPPQKEVLPLFKKTCARKTIDFGVTNPPFAMPDLESFGFGMPHVQNPFDLITNSQTTITLKSVVEELQQNKVLSPLLKNWHAQKADHQALIPFLQKKLSEGTCYGQVMAFLSKIRGQNSNHQNIQALYDSVRERDCIKYQLLHHLHVFSHHAAPQRLREIFFESSMSAPSQVVSMFPVTHPKGMNAKQIAAHDKSALINRLDKLLSKFPEKRTAVICVFSNNRHESGHASLIYSAPKDRICFFYDSFSPVTSGLFTANTKKALVNGSVDNLVECAMASKQTAISMHLYPL